MKININSSSEFMMNYRQSSILSPQKQFQAIQTSEGRSLFFCIGTDDILYLVREQSNQAEKWTKTDLSSYLSNKDSKARVKAFKVSQDLKKNTVDIVIAVATNDEDHVYTVLDLPNEETTWSHGFLWTRQAYDGKKKRNTSLRVNDIYLAEGTTGKYIVVDIFKNSANGNNFVNRYFLDPSKKLTGRVWNEHDLSINLDAGKIKSCLGRRKGKYVDGIYTMGSINAQKELIYNPLYNAFDPSQAPTPTRLVLPPEATAIAVDTDKANGTNLFVIGGNGLYFFSGDQQQDGSQGVKIFEHDLFINTSQLFVNSDDSKVVVWGLNQNKQIFYTKCPKGKEGTATAWSIPIPILEEVQQVSPYLNQADAGITFFAQQGNGNLRIATQSPTNQLWSFNSITLPAPSSPAKGDYSYTTHLQIRNENNQPLANQEVTLCLASPADLYINNLYYSLDTQPVKIKSNSDGNIHIVEWVNGLKATRFKLYHDEASASALTVNPMDKPMARIANIQTIEDLNEAKIQNHDGTSSPLAEGISDKDKTTFVNCVKNLTQAYTELNQKDTSTKLTTFMSLAKANEDKDSGYIKIEAGDLLSWVKNELDAAIDVIKDAGSGAWHFTVNLSGKVYGFVLDCAEKVVDALDTTWKAIKAKAEKLWDYLKFIFEWEDMVRTKEVMNKLIGFYFDQIVDWLNHKEEIINKGAQEAKEVILAWKDSGCPTNLSNPAAVINGWVYMDHTKGINDLQSASKITYQGSQNFSIPVRNSMARKDSSPANSAPSNMLKHHFQTNINRSSFHSPAGDTLDKILSKFFDDNPNGESIKKDVIRIIGTIGQTISNEEKDIKNLIADVQKFWCDTQGNANPNWEESVKKIISDLAIMAIDLFAGIADTLLELFILIVDVVRHVLEQPLHIPILSEVLKDVFDITLPSILDIIIMIGAVPGTIVFKNIHDRAPYPEDDAFTKLILNAKNYDDFKSKVPGANLPEISIVGDRLKLSDAANNTIMGVTNILQGYTSSLKTALEVIEEEAEAEEPMLPLPIGILGMVGFGTSIFTTVLNDVQLSDPSPMDTFSTILSNFSILEQITFKVLPSSAAEGENPIEPIAAGIDAIIALLGLVPTTYSLVELAKEGYKGESTIDGVIDAYSGITGNVGTIVGFAGLVDPEEISKQILIAVGTTFGLISSELQLVEGLLMIKEVSNEKLELVG